MSNFKEGDWVCTQCGDHQFARNTECRRCGLVRPVVSNNRQASKPGDWICPNPQCQDLQFERNFECRRCGTPNPNREGGESYDRAARGPPRSYSTGHAQDHGGYPAGGGGGYGRDFGRSPGDYGRGREPERYDAAPRGGMKEGDWLCPRCGDHQFARNSECRRCGEIKPPEGRGPYDRPDRYERDYGERYDRYERYDRGGFRDQRDGYRPPPPSGGRYETYERDMPPRQPSSTMKEGDWLCSACGDHQFARNTACRRCGAAKPDEGASYGAARTSSPYGGNEYRSPYGGGGGGGGPRMGGDRDFKPGDWSCPDCGDHQFMRNEVCRRCGAAKPSGSESQHLKPGDWLCPNPECKDLQFAKNLSCRKCGTVRPEAEEEVPQEEEVVEEG